VLVVLPLVSWFPSGIDIAYDTYVVCPVKIARRILKMQYEASPIRKGIGARFNRPAQNLK